MEHCFVEDDSHREYGYRWVVLAAFGLVLCVQAFVWLTFAPIESSVEKLLGVSATQVRLLALIGPFMFIPFASYAGSLADRKGFKYSTGIGITLIAAAAVVRAVVPHVISSSNAQYWIFLALQMVAGTGAVFALANLSKMPIKWFSVRQRALGTGLTTMSMYLGTAIGLPLIAFLASIPRGASATVIESGVNRVFIIVAAVMVISGAVFFILAREEPPTPSGPIPDEEVLPLGESLKRFFKSPSFRALALVSLIGYGIYIAMTVTMEKIITFHGSGFSTGFASLVASGITIGGIIGAGLLPALSEKVGLRKPFLIVAGAVTIPAMLIIGFVPSKGFDLIAAAVMGFFLMPALPITFTMVGEMKEIGPKLAGTAVGTLLAVGSMGSAGVPLLMELLGRKKGPQLVDYRWSIVLLAALAVITVVIIIVYVRETGPRSRPVMRA
jgi:MFS family permease